jgi:sulfatase maturation enzyme AslB (radical SAM superfamily)
MANGVELEKIEWVMSEIEKTYGKDLQRIYLSGSAEPFASKSFRKLLTNFDKTKYPKVYDIQLHTNGTLFNQKMWEDMKEIQGMIKVIEISIDAATKETYQKIRRGGNWEDLMDNLNFLKTLPMGFILSMVVQDTNYKEMELFYNNMINLFDNKGSVFFKKITNWKTYSENEFKTKEIFNPTHSNFNDFLLELSKIDNKPNCSHNFHDIIVEHGSYKTKLI